MYWSKETSRHDSTRLNALTYYSVVWVCFISSPYPVVVAVSCFSKPFMLFSLQRNYGEVWSRIVDYSWTANCVQTLWRCQGETNKCFLDSLFVFRLQNCRKMICKLLIFVNVFWIWQCCICCTLRFIMLLNVESYVFIDVLNNMRALFRSAMLNNTILNERRKHSAFYHGLISEIQSCFYSKRQVWDSRLCFLGTIST